MFDVMHKGAERGRLTALPLAVAYGAVPLGSAAARFSGDAAAVTIMAPWLLLALLGTLTAMYRPSPGSTGSIGKLVFRGILFGLLLFGLFTYLPDVFTVLAPFIPYIREISPFVFLLLCGLWVVTFGMPDRRDFQRFGALLGALCIIDAAAELYFYQALPAARWLGNADMLAGLLLVALCASLKPGPNDGGGLEPDQGVPYWRAFIMAGLLACMSRTGLFAAAWVVLCFGRGRWPFRLGYTVACAVCMVLTFLLPVTASDSARYADYWLWVEALRLYDDSISTLFTGFPIDSSLPIRFPAGISLIWETATGSPSDMGALLPQIPSFWLRSTLAWGLGVPLLLMTTIFTLLFMRLTRMGAGLVAALFAQGMTTPLLYDPTMAVTIGLGFILALSAPPVRPNTRVAESAAPETDDPVREWNLRPDED